MRKIVVIILWMACFTAWAQDDKINTDLPDQSDGTYVLKPARVQIEEKLWLNYLAEHSNAWISSTMVRVGVVKDVEVRLLVEEGKGRDIYIEETAQGLSPLALSAKWAFLKKHKILPDLTFVTYLQLPFTSQSSERKMLWSPTFLLAAEKKVKKFAVSFNGGWKQNNFDPQGTWSMVYSVRYQLSKRTQVFGEYFGQYASSLHPSHNVDAGMQYDIRKNIQVFVTTGTAIDAEEWKAFIATGLAVRLF